VCHQEFILNFTSLDLIMIPEKCLFFAIRVMIWLYAAVWMQAVNAQDSLITRSLPAGYAALEKYNKDIRFNQGEDTVIAICTGYISTNKQYPEPVFVWLIKSPSGNYLVDAGLSPLICDKNYFKGISKIFFDREFTFYLYKSNYLPLHLKNYGVNENNLKAIILTHAHFDHIGYLDYFKKVKVILTGEEKKQVQDKGQLAGYQKDTDHIINLNRCDALTIEEQKVKELSESITLIRTDEHTKGHQMILVNTGSGNILFTGDINISKLSANSPLLNCLNKITDLKSTRLFFNHDQHLGE
jgi:glyoxylase-like metal-dependent hydrolase (beta-lactamase superfamily II)